MSIFETKEQKIQKQMEKTLEQNKRFRENLKKMGLEDLDEKDIDLVKEMKLQETCGTLNQVGLMMQGKDEIVSVLQMMRIQYAQMLLMIRLLSRLNKNVEQMQRKLEKIRES